MILMEQFASRENEVPCGSRQCGLRNQLSLCRSHCCHEQWESVSDCADGSHTVFPVGKSAGSAAPITCQPDVAGGHCTTLQCSVVTAVLALVAEREASSVSVWVNSCDRLSRRSCSSFAPGEPSPMQTFAEWVGGLSWGGVPLKNISVSREIRSRGEAGTVV